MKPSPRVLVTAAPLLLLGAMAAVGAAQDLNGPAVSPNLQWGDLGAMAGVFGFVAIVAGLVGATWFRRYFAPVDVVDRVASLEETKAGRDDLDATVGRLTKEMEALTSRLTTWVGSHPEGQRDLLKSFQESLRTALDDAERTADSRMESLRKDFNGLGQRLDQAFKEIGDNRKTADEAIRRAEKAQDLASRNRAFLERNAQRLDDELQGVRELAESVVEIRSVMRIMYPEAAERVLGQHFTSNRTRTRRGGDTPKHEGE